MFIPALSPNFDLDHLLLPFAERHAAAILVSAAELSDRQFTNIRLPLWLDSGGFAAFNPESEVVEDQDAGWGILHRKNRQTITPHLVMSLADQLDAALEFTLDFPTRDDAQRADFQKLGEMNALWRLTQPRLRPVFAAVQPGQALGRILAARPDGLGLGGLVPFARDPDRLVLEVRRVREQTDLPLHVFGLGHPDAIALVMRHGATSCDSASPQRQAVSGRAWGETPILQPSLPERLNLAQRNVLRSLAAARISPTSF